MNTQIISPFKGPPFTDRRTDRDGKTEFWVQTHTLTPLRAKVADAVAGLITLGVTANQLYEVAHQPQASEIEWAIALLIAPLCHPLTRRFSRWFFKTYTTLRLTQDRFGVRRYFRWRNYDRKLPHKITLLPHDKTQLEHEQNEIAVRKAAARGQLITRPRYYGNSYHLVYEYVGQRIDVMAIFGRKEALQIATRLKACDEVLKQQAHQSDGVALNPDAQWDDQPGDL